MFHKEKLFYSSISELEYIVSQQTFKNPLGKVHDKHRSGEIWSSVNSGRS
jgi:hypothetical protein